MSAARNIASRALACALAACLPAAGMAGGLDPERWAQHARELTAEPHRLAGTQEGGRAAAYVERRLRELKGEVFSQRFTFPQEVVDECRLVPEGGETVPLLPLCPNGLQPSATPSNGLAGRVVYVGSRRFAPTDVLDWDRFLAALRPGATNAAAGPAARVAALLDEGLRRRITEENAGDQSALRRDLAAAISDSVLPRPDFYQAGCWAAADLRPAARNLVRELGYGLSPDRVHLLNRLLIEDAFPGMIARAEDSRDLRGCIAVADLGDAARFADFFRMGALALVLVGGPRDDPEAPGTGRAAVSANLPRFYISEQDARAAGLLGMSRARVFSRVRWEKRTGRNLFFLIRGSAPMFDFGADEYVILSAPLDSGGMVPRRSRSPEWAANAAALLETGRVLSEQPPRRHVLLAFFDNHANFLQGGREFYAALRRSNPERIEDPLQVRLAAVEDERACLARMRALYSGADLFTSSDPLKARALKRLADESKARYNNIMQAMADLRLACRKDGLDPAAVAADIERLAGELKDWQAVREAVRDKRPVPSDRGRAVICFSNMLAEAGLRLEGRLYELDEIAAKLSDEIALFEALGKAAPVCHVAYRFTAGAERWLFLPHGLNLHVKMYGTLLDSAGTSGAGPGFAWESRGVWQAIGAGPVAYLGFQSVEESALADTFEIPALTLATELDRAPCLGKPDAGPAAAELDSIRRQASEFLPFLALLANEPWASAPNRMVQAKNAVIEDYLWRNDQAEGHAVRGFVYGDTEAGRVEAGAVVRVASPEGQEYVAMSDGNGVFPLTPVLANFRNPRLEAARFDSCGLIEALSVSAPGGPVASVNVGWHRAGAWRSKSVVGYYSILTLFEGDGVAFLGRSRPLEGPCEERAFRVLDGLSNSQFQKLHMRFDPACGVGLCYAQRPLGMKLIYNNPRNGDDVLFFLNATEEQPAGVGYGPGSPGWTRDGDRPCFVLDLQRDMARDMWTLNESRLARLRRKNIILNYVEYLHALARTPAAAAKASDESARAGTGADTDAVTAAALERRVYRPVMSTTNDMVKAVTVLLMLAVPFALALQSLLLPSSNVYRQIGGFALFFGLSFGVLYFAHPAFAFSATPIVIILAFLIMLMSGAVIWMIGDRFAYEVKKMQGLAAAAHAFEHRLLGNVSAAASLAISIMQRRPARTTLTVVTVLLLTFTILSFMAFQSEPGVTRISKGPADDQVSRLMLRHKVWGNMGADVEAWRRFLARSTGGGVSLHGRYWLSRGLSADAGAEDMCIPLRHSSGAATVAGSAMSLDEIEIERLDEIRRVLAGVDAAQFAAGRGICLSRALADELGAKPGDRIRVMGLDLDFLGAFDARALLNLRQIDGSPMLPVNFGSTRAAMGELKVKGSAGGGIDVMADLEEELSRIEPEAMEPVNPDTLMLVPTALADRLGMSLKAVMIYPQREGLDLERLAEELAVAHFDGVHVNLAGERSFFHYGPRAQMAGAADVAIPLILGGLIVFSTMLGSIIDREKEIYTFSALGLAPRSIAMLFFVEAGIYAVIGGFGGYLLSQAVVRALEALAALGLFRAPELNYSSTTVINTILLVMATVLVSTIYPALKAARKATAETMSRWRIPAPRAGLLEFDFPFTISRYDIAGIICFLAEHFANHADRTVGKFAADDVAVRREPVHGLASLSARIWLQPFDQGISQRFDIAARPSDIEEVCEIRVRLERLSGPPQAWRRAYLLFLEDLRAQFLLWRTLSDEAREHYLCAADKAEAEMAGGPATATAAGALAGEYGQA